MALACFVGTLLPGEERPEAKQRDQNPDGLVIAQWTHGSGSKISITIRNLGSSQVNFNFHQLRAVVIGSGKVVPAGNVHFNLSEISSYTINPGQGRLFTVEFTGSERIAGVGWIGSDQWVNCANEIDYSATRVANSELKSYLELRRKHRAGSLLGRGLQCIPKNVKH